ncbi:MAG: T9SS type A sorting domain-containing protein [Bacteroidota bacterium]
MKSQFNIWCLLGLLLWGAGVPTKGFAADEWGAELRYEALGGQRYEVFLTRYYECSTTPNTPDTPALSFVLNGCTVPVAESPWQVGSAVDVTPLCPTLPTNCGGSPSPFLPGIEQVTFSRIFQMAPTCQYEIIYRSCCRSDSITSGAADSHLSISMLVDTDPLFEGNHAPEFLAPAAIYLDDSTLSRISLGANDPDGDSLGYVLIPCMDSSGSPVPYAGGYFATSPLGPDWEVQLDPLTGNLSFMPQPGGAVVGPVCLEVREYRQGQLIGRYSRDFMVQTVDGFVSPPTPNLPVIPSPQKNNGFISGATWVDSFVVRASLGRQMNISFKAIDPDNGGSLETTLSWEGLPDPTAEFFDSTQAVVINSFTDTLPTGTFSWNPQKFGRHSFILSAVESPIWCGPGRIHEQAVIIDVRDTCLYMQLAEAADSLFFCPGDTLTLKPNIFKGSGLYTYTWNTPPPFNNDSIRVSSAGMFALTLRDITSGCEVNDTVHVLPAPLCVWPGDTDNDGTANNLDVLSIGLGYGSVGAPRSSNDLSWSGKQPTAWGDTLPGGLDKVFVDANGDGIIDLNDTLAIQQNYDLSHQKGSFKTGGPGSPFLLFQPPAQAVRTRDTLNIPILLGTDTLPADSVYGIAFTVSYNSQVVDSGSAKMNLDSCWLGTQYTDMFSLQRDRFNDGKIDVGISRNDLGFRSSYGQIARFDIIMVDDIAGKRTGEDTLRLAFERIRIIRPDGTELPIQTQEVKIVVRDRNVSNNDPLSPDNWRVYPNPSTGDVFIRIAQEFSEEVSVQAFNLQGQQVGRLEKHQEGWRMRFPEHQPNGLLMLHIRHNDRQLVKKIWLQR